MKHSRILVLSVSMIGGMVMAMNQQQQGPMSAEWFYAQHNPFKTANDLHQARKWKEAEVAYKQKLEEGVGTEYDQDMAKLNLAACLMAQRESTEHWNSFDKLIGIPQENRLSQELLVSKEKKSVLIRTDQVGIGDIVHFLATANVLKKKRPDWDVTVSVRPFLKNTISNVVQGYGCTLISEKDEQPKTDYTTHIIGLLGHLKMGPNDTKPDKFFLEAPERAKNVVNEQLKTVLEQGKTVLISFAGEDRQATLIGSKKLPLQPTDYGRQIHPIAFQLLLKKNPNLVLLDCGTPSSRIPVDENNKDRYMTIAKEEQAFDTIVALAAQMSANKKILAIAADQGPSNVFARSISTIDGQQRMAFIIPNPDQYDMRMEGEGSTYQQMISDCLVLKSNSSDVHDQYKVLKKALKKMENNK